MTKQERNLVSRTPSQYTPQPQQCVLQLSFHFCICIVCIYVRIIKKHYFHENVLSSFLIFKVCAFMMHLFKADVPYFNKYFQCINQSISHLAPTPGWRSGPAKARPEIVSFELLEILSIFWFYCVFQVSLWQFFDIQLMA